tara:strand:+ start:2171 stop:2605 length:435 start_codon:yes stop_codon:yes gene_type:complete
MTNRVLALLLFLLGVNACATAEQPETPGFAPATIQIAGVSRVVQLADTPALRERGFMFQQSAEPGMLLLYSEPRLISLWMRNTDLALDVAFVDPQWRIMAITPLHPLDETPVSSPSLALAALEMPRGWFASHNIKVGDTLKLIR